MSTLERINKVLLDEATKRFEEKKTPLNVFYPSSVGQCVRKAYNEKINPKMFPVDTYKIFLIGNLTHDWLQNKVYPDGKHEVPIRWEEGDIIISGRIDCLLEDTIIEFKSIAKLDYVRNAPKSEHVEQLNLYLHALKMTKGVIVYVTKNNLEIVEHEITYSEKIYKKTINAFKRIYWYVSRGVEPKPKKCSTPWSCEYCKIGKEK